MSSDMYCHCMKAPQNQPFKFKCDFCNYAFAYSSNLTRQSKTKTKRQVAFTADVLNLFTLVLKLYLVLSLHERLDAQILELPFGIAMFPIFSSLFLIALTLGNGRTGTT